MILGMALKSRSLIFLIVVTILAFNPNPTTIKALQVGPIFYVAVTGNDANPGTLAQPFRTIRHGLSVLVPGSTLQVRAGTYAEELMPADFPSGTSFAAPITLQAFPGETVILRPNPGAQRVITFGNTSQYIIVDGFIMDARNVSIDGIKMQYDPAQPGNPNHIRIINCEIENARHEGILTGTNADFLEFINLNVHDNGTNGRFDHGIYILGHSNLIEGGRYYRNSSNGIQCDSGPCQNNIVRDTITFDNGVHDVDGRGIGFYMGSNNLIYNNIAYDNPDGGIKILNNISTKVYNNTVYHNGTTGIWVDNPNTGIIVRNNIAFGSIGGPDIIDTGTGTIKDHNLTGVNPLFVNAAAHDFHLKLGSPGIDTGVTLADVPNDFDGVTRPQGPAYDRGAYEALSQGQKSGIYLGANTIRWTMLWVNVDPQQASTLTDTLPAGQTFAGNLACTTPLGSTTTTTQCAFTGSTLTWTGSLSTGAANRLQVTYDVKIPGFGTYQNTGTLTIGAGAPKTAVGTVIVSAGSGSKSTNQAILIRDPSISKSADQTIGGPGSNVVWTVTVTNPNSIALINVVVNDPIPDSLQILSATTSIGTTTVNGQNVTILIPLLSGGQTATIVITTRINQGIQPGDIINIASFAGGFQGQASAVVHVIAMLPKTGEHPG